MLCHTLYHNVTVTPLIPSPPPLHTHTHNAFFFQEKLLIGAVALVERGTLASPLDQLRAFSPAIPFSLAFCGAGHGGQGEGFNGSCTKFGSTAAEHANGTAAIGPDQLSVCQALRGKE